MRLRPQECLDKHTQAPQTLFAIALQSPVTIVLRKLTIKVQAGCALYQAGQP